MSQGPESATASKPNLEHQPVVGQKFFTFSFFHGTHALRLLPKSDRERHVQEFFQVIKNEPSMSYKSYSTIGLRRDSDFFLWYEAPTIEPFQKLHVNLYKTTLWNYLNMTYNYLAMVKPSPYFSKHTHKEEPPKGDVRYAFVYPFVKTRAWYALPFPERMTMLKEHTEVGHDFPSVRINTAYSFGIDDQEFTLCFESDHPDHFVNLVQKLRETRASSYTERDTPMFVGERKDLLTILEETAGI